MFCIFTKPCKVYIQQGVNFEFNATPVQMAQTDLNFKIQNSSRQNQPFSHHWSFSIPPEYRCPRGGGGEGG